MAAVDPGGAGAAAVRAALDAIAAEPDRVAQVLDEHEEPLLAFTPERRILAANAAAERFFGYDRHHLDGRLTDAVVPERFRQPDAPPQPLAPELTIVEVPGLRGDGAEAATRWTFASVETRRGPIFVLAVRDLATIALEIDAWRRNDSRYRTLLLASASVVWVASPAGELVERQPAWEAFTGQSWEEYRGSGWIQAVHPDDRDRVMRSWTEALQAGAEVYRSQGRIWSAQHQTWRAFQTRAVAVRGPGGAPTEWVGSLTDVQEAVDAQERLRAREHELEHQFRAIYENALDGIVLSDDDLRVVDANPAACRLLGRPRERMVGCSVAELMPPDDRAATAARMGEFRSAGQMTGEGRILLPDGTIRRAEFGSVANVSAGLHLTSFRDIEDRKRTEETQQFLDEASTALASSLDCDETLAAMARLAVPRIADWAAVDMLEEDGTFRRLALAHADPAKLDLGKELGRQRPSTLQDPTGVGAVVRTGKPALVQRVTDDVLAAALADRPERLEQLRRLGLVSAMTVPLSARGRVIGALSFVSAESRRRYGPADLAFAEELARRMAYAVENALIVRDLRQANRSKDLFLQRAEHLQATAAQLVRAESVEAIGRAFASEEPKSPVAAAAWSLYLRAGDELRLVAATPAIRDRVGEWVTIPVEADTPLAQAARTGQPSWFQDSEEMLAAFPAVRRDGLGVGLGARVVLPLAIGGQPIGVLGVLFQDRRAFDPDERAYLTAVANLWGQALHWARLAEAEREAIPRALEAETLATRKKDEFLAMLGHELRNPLAPILTATSLLRVRGRATGRELEILDRQARHMVRLVDDLMDISRITSGKLTLKRGRVELAEVIAQAIESTSALFEEKNLRLFSEVTRPVLVVDGDRERLVQVIANVLVNAAKFTPPGRAVFVTASRAGAGAILTVRDQGQGIDPELLPRVFELFSQGKQSPDRRSGGLGLGLAIAHSIVAAHQGEIEVTSPGVGEGTTVTIRLPLAAASARAPGDRADALEPAPGSAGRHRVLIVDDNEDSAEMLAAFLGEVGYDCYVASDARRALALSREVLPHAAILDIGLPDLDGHELARELRSALAERTPKLIALTGYAQDGDRRRAMEAGFAEHLAKPVEMTKLTAKLSGLLGALPA
jgi:PAS domain S-box-containing protein